MWIPWPEASNYNCIASSDEWASQKVQQGSSRAFTTICRRTPEYLEHIRPTTDVRVQNPDLSIQRCVFIQFDSVKHPEDVTTGGTTFDFPSVKPSDLSGDVSLYVLSSRLLTNLDLRREKLDCSLTAAERQNKFDYGKRVCKTTVS